MPPSFTIFPSVTRATHNERVKHLYGTVVPSPSRRARVASTSLLVLALVSLSACATPTPGAAPVASDTASPSASPSAPVTASPSPADTADPSPAPSESATGSPYNGEILVITSEVRDGSLEVTAMVPGVSESGGTCTLTLEESQRSVSVSGNEGKEVTYCGLMSIPVAEGEDVAFTVSYASANLRAQSATATIETAP